MISKIEISLILYRKIFHLYPGKFGNYWIKGNAEKENALLNRGFLYNQSKKMHIWLSLSFATVLQAEVAANILCRGDLITKSPCKKASDLFRLQASIKAIGGLLSHFKARSMVLNKVSLLWWAVF